MPKWCLGLWVGVILLGLAAAAAPPQDEPEIVIEKYELPNGLDVILYPDPSLPVVSVNLWYHVGSKNERPDRTGLAHLVEHMMFKGSAHYDTGYFEPLQKIGGAVNGSTNADRTAYWQDVPSHYLGHVLWLEADRMGFLLPAMTQQKLDTQRNVVKNERRQRYDNQPYAKWRLLLPPLLYPPDHPYAWATIGRMADVSAASLTDVSVFFNTYYTPNNASLAIVGDVDTDIAKFWVRKYFGPLPSGPEVPQPSARLPELAGPKRVVVGDQVAFPQLHYAWHTPALYAPGDAEFTLLAHILAKGKASRLFKALVYEHRLAHQIRAFQSSQELSSTFHIIVTAPSGQSLELVEHALDAELEQIRQQGVTASELERAQRAVQSAFVRRRQHPGLMADQLNAYNTYLGDPNQFHWDLARYATSTVDGVRVYAHRYLDPKRRVTLVTRPQAHMQWHDGDRHTPPALLSEPTFVPPSIQRTTLSNGLEVLVVEDHRLPLVQADLVVKSGWAADPVERPGIAWLTASLLDDGTRTRSLLDIAVEAEQLAARFTTTSFYDSSTVRLNVLTPHLPDGLALVADVVLHPTFPQDELKRQRGHSRIQLEAKQPRTLALKAFHRLLYGARHPYGQSYTGSGTLASRNAITRHDIEQYYRTHYRPNNAALILVGDITLAQAASQAEQLFGAWQPGPLPEQVIPEPTPLRQTQVYLLDKPEAVQSVIVVGTLGIRRHDPAYPAFRVMTSAFGSKFQSRLNLKLREDKGYTYSARTFFRTLRGAGPFALMTSVQTSRTRQSLVEILNEIGALVGPRPLTEVEVAAAKDYLIKEFPQQFHTLSGIAHQLSQHVIYGLPDDEWRRYASSLQRITAEHAARTAVELLDPAVLLIVVVGDRAKIEADLRELELGEMKVLPASTLE